MNTQAHTHDSHIVPLRTYLLIAAALFIMTGLTVGVSYINLGGWNVVIALFIAGVKATLVALIFMHLWYDSKVYALILLTAILFLVLLIIFTMFDNMTRGSIYEIRSEPISKEAEIYDQSSAAVSGAGLQHGESGDKMESQEVTTPGQHGGDSAAAATGGKNNPEGH